MKIKASRHSVWPRALALLLTLTAAAANATPQIDSRTLYYDVTGTDPQSLRASLARRGPPAVDGVRGNAYTATDLEWKFQHKLVRGQCTVVSVTVKLNVVITLPRWLLPPNADPNLRAAWEAALRGLTEHEDGHAERARQAAVDIERALWRAELGSSCQDANDELNAVAQARYDALYREHRAYDAATDYGATQGAVFP